MSVRGFPSWVFGLGVFLAACGAPDHPQDRPWVVASFSILGDLVAQVAGTDVTVVSLVGPNSDAHTFEPSPQDLLTIEGARLVFRNGIGLDPWLDKPLAQSAVPVVTVTDNLDLLRTSADDHRPGEFDPHVWHSVPRVKQIVATITAALTQAFPAWAEAFAQRSAAYQAELDNLDQELRQEFAAVAPERRLLATNHDSLGYLASEYGLQILATILPSTEDEDPSPRELIRLIDTLQSHRVRAVLSENVASTALADTLAREAKVALVTGLYTDALGPPASEGDSYLKMMRSNARLIVQALQ